MHTCFRASKAFKVSSESDTCSDFPSGSFPSQMVILWMCNKCKPLDKSLVVANQSHEGMHPCIGLGQCALSDGLQVRITGLHSIF